MPASPAMVSCADISASVVLYLFIAGYGWVQNISDSGTRADPQTDITAVEGENVTLTLYFTKNYPPNEIRFRFFIETNGTATGM